MGELFQSIRKNHKTTLVEAAFRIYNPVFDNQSTSKDLWIQKLLDGHDIYEFISQLKLSTLDSSLIDVNQSSRTDSLYVLEVVDTDLSFHADLNRRVWVRIENKSTKLIQTSSDEPIFASYHWYKNNSDVYLFDGVRTPLPQPIPPGQKVEIGVNVIPPKESGIYKLMVTLVHEGCFWMEEVGLQADLITCAVHDYDGSALSRHARSVFEQLVEGRSNKPTEVSNAYCH